MKTTYELGKPWIVWHYTRPYWLAFLLGGLIIGECAKCGAEERLRLGRWMIWFPPTQSGWRHPLRDDFIGRHMHPERVSRWEWAKPLLNLGASR